MPLQEQILQYLITGLTTGSIYALLSLGVVVIFAVRRVLNFAQGEFMMLGALFMATFLKDHLPIPLSFILAVLISTAVGAGLERVVIRPARGASVVTLINITLGASITIRGLGLIGWGPDPYQVPAFSGETALRVWGATIAPQALWVIGTTALVLACLYLFFERTIWGKALRACSMNGRAARLMGISTSRMTLLSFALSGALGAIGGAVIAPITTASYDMGLTLLVQALTGALLGGLGSLPGAVVGGFLLGILEAVGGGFISSGYRDAIPFIVLLLLLFLRPHGLFGDRTSSGEEFK